MTETILIFVCFLFISAMYSSVGHGGASGYLAVMSLFSFSPGAIKPTALVLNIVVAGLAGFQLMRAGYFDKRIFFSFALSSLPAAFFGGYISIPPYYFIILAGSFLLVSAILLFFKEWIRPGQKIMRPMPLTLGLMLGCVIGVFSGIIGVGGGIFLSPVLILGNYATVKNTAGISAVFILCNSMAGLAGHLASLQSLDKNLFLWVGAVMIGGATGTFLCRYKFNNKPVLFMLVIILLTAGFKLLWGISV